MVCIFSPGSVKTLCNGKVTDHVGYFKGKVDCTQCLIRQDAMFERGYQQTKYSICYNEYHYKARLFAAYGIHIWFRGAIHIAEFMAWDSKTLRGAIKLGKMGVCNMGTAK